jgi:glycosyltransferase involved in cell wall biosynthesis
MKRVLLVIPSIASAGGAEQLVMSLAGLLKGIYDIRIASFDPIGTTPYFQCTVPFYPLGQGWKLPLVLRWVTYISAARRLLILKRLIGVELAISVLWRADLINMLSRSGEQIMSLAVINILENPSNITMVKMRALVGHVYRRFDRILSIAPEIQSELLTLYRLDPTKMGHFKSFIACPETPAIFSDGRPRFVFCGRAVYEKNIDGLLHAYALYTARNLGRQLVIIGDGALLEEMKSLAVTLGLSIGTAATSKAQVLFVGASATPEAFMRGARAFVLTSRHEGVPTVAMLAAALGLPILAADCRGGGMRLLFKLDPGTPLSDPEADSGPAAGLLLPIPEPSSPDTLKVWALALEVADLNKLRRQEWVAGASSMAADYSPEAVQREWVSTVESMLA